MAVNPYFTFADPALQQAVVQEAQVQAAAEAARAQQRAATLTALRQERQQRADLEERRAIREGDIRRLDANEAERRRQFYENMKFNRDALASQEKIASGRQGRNTDDERYNNLIATMSAAEKGSADLLTEKELEALIIGFEPERQRALRGERNRVFTVLSRNANLIDEEVAGLNKLLDTKAKDAKGAEYTLDTVLNLSQFKGNIRKNRVTGRLESLAPRPRTDGVAARMPGTEDIGQVFARLPGAIAQSAQDAITPMIERADTFGGRVGAALRGAGGLFSVDRLDPVPPNAPFMRAPAFVPAPQAAPMLGNQGVLAPLDYSGPEFDYSRPRFAVPPQIDPELERLLAPPVFAPAY